MSKGLVKIKLEMITDHGKDKSVKEVTLIKGWPKWAPYNWTKKKFTTPYIIHPSLHILHSVSFD